MKRLQRALAFQKHNNGVRLYEFDLISEALELFKEAVQLAPGYSKYWESIALVEIEQGNYETALKCINKLFKFKSANRDYLFLIKGDTYQRLGEYRKALRCYCCVSPKNCHLEGVKARKIKCYMGLGEYKKALKISPSFVRSILKNNPDGLIWSC